MVNQPHAVSLSLVRLNKKKLILGLYYFLFSFYSLSLFSILIYTLGNTHTHHHHHHHSHIHIHFTKDFLLSVYPKTTETAPRLVFYGVDDNINIKMRVDRHNEAWQFDCDD